MRIEYRDRGRDGRSTNLCQMQQAENGLKLMTQTKAHRVLGSKSPKRSKGITYLREKSLKAIFFGRIYARKA